MVRFVLALLVPAGFAFAGGTEVRILVRDGDPVTGTLVGLERFAVETDYGTVQVPVSDLFMLWFLEDRVRADTAEGTFRGRLALESVRVKTRFGTVAVPTASMRRILCDGSSAAAPDTKVTVLLADRSYARGRLTPAVIDLDTSYGVLKIPLDRMRSLHVEDGVARVRVDGDELKGTLPDRAWTMETRYGVLKFRTAALRRVGSLALPRVGETLEGGYKVVAVERFRGHTYALVQHPDGIDWMGAWTAARILDGHLATIADREEQEFLLRLGRRGGRETCWIGLTDEDEEGKWKWVTGEPVEFTAWNAGEPNNANGRENGAEMILDQRNGAWNDIPLSQHDRGGCLIELDR